MCVIIICQRWDWLELPSMENIAAGGILRAAMSNFNAEVHFDSMLMISSQVC